MNNDIRNRAEQFLKKRSVQKDNLVITKQEAISGLIDFASQEKEIALSKRVKEKLNYINGHCITRNFPNEKPDLIWVGAVLDLLEELNLNKNNYDV